MLHYACERVCVTIETEIDSCEGHGTHYAFLSNLNYIFVSHIRAHTHNTHTYTHTLTHIHTPESSGKLSFARKRLTFYRALRISRSVSYSATFYSLPLSGKMTVSTQYQRSCQMTTQYQRYKARRARIHKVYSITSRLYRQHGSVERCFLLTDRSIKVLFMLPSNSFYRWPVANNPLERKTKICLQSTHVQHWIRK